MKLLTGNVSRTIDQLAKEMGVTTRTVYRYIDTIREAGFVVNKLYGNVYAMGKVARGLSDFNKNMPLRLIHHIHITRKYICRLFLRA